MKRILLAAAAVVMLAASAHASDGSPINLSLFDPVQIVNRDESVKGFRLNVIYTRNVDMKGLDLGFIFNRTDGEFKGLQMVPVAYTLGNSTGWCTSIVSITEGHFTGLQGGLGANALFNKAGSTNGVQLGWINMVDGRMAGVQLGLVNVADSANGLQIGLFNLIGSKEKFSWLPIVNWQF